MDQVTIDNMILFEELKEKLAEQLDHESICELLDISEAELVEAFQDKVEANFSKCVRAIE